jgi:hypothetical protein
VTLMEGQIVEVAGDLNGMMWRTRVSSSTSSVLRSWALPVAIVDRLRRLGDGYRRCSQHGCRLVDPESVEAGWRDEDLVAGACETDLATGERVERDDLQ